MRPYLARGASSRASQSLRPNTLVQSLRPHTLVYSGLQLCEARENSRLTELKAAYTYMYTSYIYIYDICVYMYTSYIYIYEDTNIYMENIYSSYIVA
jgi:hypothetical protein